MIYNFIGAIVTILSLVACIVVSTGKSGRQLVGTSKQPSWDNLSWVSGIFVSAIGASLVCLHSDLTSLTAEGYSPLETLFLLWNFNGVAVWAMFAIVAYWYSRHMNSKIGKIAAMLSTIIGMAISMWTGTRTIIKLLGFTATGLEFYIAGVMVVLAVISAKYNMLKKMSRFATFFFIVIIFVTIACGAWNGTFSFGRDFNVRAFREYFFGDTSASWWFWNISWVPTVSRWVARISDGRTTRQMVLTTTFVPPILTLIWTVIVHYCSGFMATMTFLTVPLPTILYILSAIFMFATTLDSDCKVFTEDLESLTKGKLKQRNMMYAYGLFVLSLSCFYIGNLVPNPFECNKYISLIFVPMFVWAFIDIYKDKK